MIDESSSIPLYYQVKKAILKSIRDEGMKKGERLMVETEMASKFNVSIGTIKRAMNELVNEKTLIRKQGKGTFLNSDLHILKPFPDILEVYASKATLSLEAVEALEANKGKGSVFYHKIINGSDTVGFVSAIFSQADSESDYQQIHSIVSDKAQVIREQIAVSKIPAGIIKVFKEAHNSVYLVIKRSIFEKENIQIAEQTFFIDTKSVHLEKVLEASQD